MEGQNCKPTEAPAERNGVEMRQPDRRRHFHTKGPPYTARQACERPICGNILPASSSGVPSWLIMRRAVVLKGVGAATRRPTREAARLAARTTA